MTCAGSEDVVQGFCVCSCEETGEEVNYPVVRHMFCLVPITITTRKESAVKNMRLLLPLLAEAERLDGVCQTVIISCGSNALSWKK